MILDFVLLFLRWKQEMYIPVEITAKGNAFIVLYLKLKRISFKSKTKTRGLSE